MVPEWVTSVALVGGFLVLYLYVLPKLGLRT
jgi:hypothetical protein